MNQPLISDPADEFTANLYAKHPSLREMLASAEEPDMLPENLPWLSDQAATPLDPARTKYRINPDNPIPIIQQELRESIDFLRQPAFAADCANNLATRLTVPVQKLLADLKELEDSRGLTGSPRLLKEHKNLSASAADFFVDFAAHLWDIAPLHNTGHFAAGLVHYRQDAQRASDRIRHDLTIDHCAKADNPALYQELLNLANDSQEQAKPPAWLASPEAEDAVYRWYATTLGNIAGSHYAHMTGVQYAQHLSQPAVQEIRKRLDEEQQHGREQALGWNLHRQLSANLFLMKEALNRQERDTFRSAMNTLREIHRNCGLMPEDK